MSKTKRIIIIVLVTCLAFVLLIIAFVSPIAKYLLEKYDEEIMGRQIKIDWAYVNPFTGYVYLNNVRIYELNKDSVFISADGLSANMAMLKLFSQTYEISECSLDRPKGFIIQKGKKLNFDDVIARFTLKKDSLHPLKPVHFNILNIKINDGEFHYAENHIPINYFIQHVHIESPGKRWDLDTLEADFSLESGIGSGAMKGNFAINFDNIHYRFDVQVKKYSLNIIEQYLKDLANYGSFSATLDAKMKAKGSFLDQDDISLSGQLAINEFHFGKTPKEDYAAFDKLEISIQEMNPEYKIFSFDSVSLRKPFFKYERYDHLDNLETMFGRKGANLQAVNENGASFNLVIEIAKYVKVLAKNFLRSSYKVDRLAVYDGNLKFNDYSINEKFSVALNPLFIRADSINKNNPRVNVHLKSGIKPFGDASVSLSINPKDSSDFDLNYKFESLPVTLFNPYIISYTSFPLDRGSLDLFGTWHVRNGNINSDNHLVITDPRLSKKIKNDNDNWLPMPLIMTIVRERGNVINYTIPITGDLKSPKFHVLDVILDLVANIFVKPLSMPYRLNLKSIKAEIEKSLSINWRMKQSTLLPSQERFIEKMAIFLKENPDATISIHPKQYMDKEKEYILFFEAKKKYFLTNHRDKGGKFEEEDAEGVDKMSIKDTMFVHYLDKQLHDKLLFTIQDKCARYVDSNQVNKSYARLNEQREQVFMSYFEKKGVQKQVSIDKGKDIVPFNGFSFYRIKYAGEFPPALIKAYDKMIELNDDAPRERFEEAKAKAI